MRVLLDTNVLARAAAGPPGLANELVLAATRPEHVLLLSPFLISELSRVLRYDRMRPVHGHDEAGIDRYVADLLMVAELVVPSGAADTIVTDDPDDDPVIAAAIAGRADLLCTKDRHFLAPEIVAHCASHGIRVVSDLDLANILG